MKVDWWIRKPPFSYWPHSNPRNEKDTPGTITGVDKSSFRNFRMRKPSSEQQETSDNSSDKASEPREQSSPVDSESGTDAKGTLAKIIDAVSENETVKFIKKKIWG